MLIVATCPLISPDLAFPTISRFSLTIPSKEVYLQSVQRSIEILLKIYDVLSIAHKGGNRGVIENRTPFLGKRKWGFCLYCLTGYFAEIVKQLLGRVIQEPRADLSP